jgi:predicted glycoside hydrolase/deacetylase ChbG (UPF0249 family)
MLRGLTCLALAMAAFSLTPLQAQRSKPASTATLAQRLGYPADSRLLIIHADDYGMMHTVNTAIEEAFEHHWITSASILVPCPWFPEVAQWAKTHPDADLGIHLALNADWTSYRWSSVSAQPKGSSLLDADGYLPLLATEVVAHAKMSDVESELHAQIDKAVAANVSRLPVASSPVSRFKPLRSFTRTGTIVLNQVLEIMPGVPQSQWLDAYKKMLQPLPPGSYQLIVHLAHNDAEMQGATFDHPDWGAQWRQNDLDLVRSPEFQKFIADQHFILISWRDLAKALQVAHP